MTVPGSRILTKQCAIAYLIGCKGFYVSSHTWLSQNCHLFDHPFFLKRRKGSSVLNIVQNSISQVRLVGLDCHAMSMVSESSAKENDNPQQLASQVASKTSSSSSSSSSLLVALTTRDRTVRPSDTRVDVSSSTRRTTGWRRRRLRRRRAHAFLHQQVT